MTRIQTIVRKRLSRARRREPKLSTRVMFFRSTTPFRYDASLRIHGVGDRHLEITEKTGLAPTRSHRRGEPRGRSGAMYEQDLWQLKSPLGERASLQEHVLWLEAAIAPHQAYFEELTAAAASADLCLGCLSESAFPFLELGEPALGIMKKLRLGFTFNFTCL